jgi:hypothetical protein
MKYGPVWLALAVIAWMPGCVRQQHIAPKTVILPSGEPVVISDARGDAFTDVSGHQRHIYYVGYRSSHGMDAIALLRVEARRVFALYLPQIIDQGYDTCVVTPMRQTVGGDDEGRPYYFTRQTNGQWSLGP